MNDSPRVPRVCVPGRNSKARQLHPIRHRKREIIAIDNTVGLACRSKELVGTRQGYRQGAWGQARSSTDRPKRSRHRSRPPELSYCTRQQRPGEHNLQTSVKSFSCPFLASWFVRNFFAFSRTHRPRDHCRADRRTLAKGNARELPPFSFICRGMPLFARPCGPRVKIDEQGSRQVFRKAPDHSGERDGRTIPRNAAICGIARRPSGFVQKDVAAYLNRDVTTRPALGKARAHARLPAFA